MYTAMFSFLIVLIFYEINALPCYNLTNVTAVDANAWSLEPTNVITSQDYNHTDARRLALRPHVNWDSDKIQILRSETPYDAITGWVTFIPVNNPTNPLTIGAQEHLDLWNTSKVPECSCDLQSDGTLSGCYGTRLFDNGCLGSTYTSDAPCLHGLVDDRYCHTRYRFYMSAQWCYSYDPGCIEETWMHPIRDAQPPNSAWNNTYTTAVSYDGTRNNVCRRYLEWNVIEIRFDTHVDIAVGSNVSLITDFAIESKVAVEFDIELQSDVCVNQNNLTEADIATYTAKYIEDLAQFLEISEYEIAIIEKRIIGSCNFVDDVQSARRRLQEDNSTVVGTALLIRSIVLPVDTLRIDEIKERVLTIEANLVTESVDTSIIKVVVVDHSKTNPPTTPPAAQTDAFTWEVAAIVVAVLFVVGLIGVCCAVGKDVRLDEEARQRLHEHNEKHRKGMVLVRRVPGKWRLKYKRVRQLPKNDDEVISP